MSDVEFESADREVMEVVNKTASPAATAAAEKIVKAVTAAPKPTSPAATTKKYVAAVYLAFRTVLCVIVAAFFLAMLVDPALEIWVVNFGVLACGIAAAIGIDRYLRREHNAKCKVHVPELGASADRQDH